MITDNTIFEEIKSFGSLRDLNTTLGKECQIQIVSVEQFKKLNKNSTNITDWMICHFEEVRAERIENDEIEFIVRTSNNGEYHVTTDGRAWLIQNSGRKHNFKSTDKIGRVRIQGGLTINNTTVYAERLLGLCCSYILDEMPSTFSNLDLQVNVLDLSGNKNTAHELGIKQWNFIPSNLEWTTRYRNTLHAHVVLRLYKELNLKNMVTKISANTVYEVSNYMSTHTLEESIKKFNIL